MQESAKLAVHLLLWTSDARPRLHYWGSLWCSLGSFLWKPEAKGKEKDAKDGTTQSDAR